MTLQYTRAGEVLIVEVDGQLDVGNRQAFKDGVLEELERGARWVVVDFTRTPFVDSSGLGAIVSLGKRARAAGGDVRLCGLNADMTALLELTRLDALFPPFASRDDALTGL